MRLLRRGGPRYFAGESQTGSGLPAVRRRIDTTTNGPPGGAATYCGYFACSSSSPRASSLDDTRRPREPHPPESRPVLVPVVDHDLDPGVRLDVREPAEPPRRLRLLVDGRVERVAVEREADRDDVRAAVAPRPSRAGRRAASTAFTTARRRRRSNRRFALPGLRAAAASRARADRRRRAAAAARSRSSSRATSGRLRRLDVHLELAAASRGGRRRSRTGRRAPDRRARPPRSRSGRR